MNNQAGLPTVEQVAARFGASVERVRESYRANAVQLTNMAAKAERTGRKVNGYTAEQLRAMSAQQSGIAAR
jgi:hypothetical protein